jgi:protein tyrosine/serine phosphatase
MTRTLAWDGLFNVRDLGGLPTEKGGRTRYGAVIRADNVRRLRDARTLLEHGVTRVVDLRFAGEREQDLLERLPVEVVHLSLLGEWDDRYWHGLQAEMLVRPAHDYLRWSYLDFLDRFRANFGAVVGAVADAPPGAVCIHCAGGRDRTGLVAALVLTAAGVSRREVVADYLLSNAYVGRLLDAIRRAAIQQGLNPEPILAHLTLRGSALEGALDALEAEHGGVEGYLHAAGVSSVQLESFRRLFLTAD